MPVANIDNNNGTDFDFILLMGQPLPIGEQVQLITRKNVDSQAYRRLGKAGPPYGMFSRVDVDDAAALKTTIDAYRELIGDFVTVTDVFGNVRDNVMVLDVEPVFQHTIVGAAGGLSTLKGALLDAAWTLQENDES